MNRPLSHRSSRTRRPPPPQVQAVPVAPPARRLPKQSGGSLVALMVWVLIIYLTLPVYMLSGDLTGTDLSMTAPNPVARSIKIGLLLLSACIVLWKRKVAWAELKGMNPFFLVFLGLVPASILWSVDPGATFNRFVSLLSIVAVCLAFTVWGWGRSRFQDVVRPVVTLLLAASIIWGLTYPEYAIETGQGTLLNSWKGLTSQKNQFGMLAGMGMVFWLNAWINKEKKWFMALPCILISFYCVILSRSSTSLLASVLSTMFMLMLMKVPRSVRRYMPFLVSAFAILVVVYALAVLNIIPGSSILLDPIAVLSGKDMTFSNRAEIWDIIKAHIAYAPFLGSGYGAYWTGPVPSSPSYAFLLTMYFYPNQSHNGYLEIVNDLGFVGLIVLLGYLVFWIRQSLALMKFDRGQATLFLALFFQQAVTNLSESTWLAINSGFGIAVTTLATFALARSVLEQKMNGAPAPAKAPRRRRR